MTTPYMACGHAAQATGTGGRPSCVLCLGFDKRAEIVAAAPNLEGREMRCTDCEYKKPSTIEGAFFKHLPLFPMDEFYCGCSGWE